MERDNQLKKLCDKGVCRGHFEASLNEFVYFRNGSGEQIVGGNGNDEKDRRYTGWGARIWCVLQEKSKG